MNKLIIDNNKYLELVDNTLININKDTILTIYLNKCNIDLTINIEKGINSKINLLNIDSDLNIDINLLDDAKLELINSSINNNNLYLNLDINHGVNSQSNLINHGININDGNMKFIVNGIVKKDMINTFFNQDNKIINLNDGVSLIDANLLIDEFDTIANHSSYIAKYNPEEEFYLLSRGINSKEVFRLLTKSFLFGKMTLTDELEAKFFEEIYKI